MSSLFVPCPFAARCGEVYRHWETLPVPPAALGPQRQLQQRQNVSVFKHVRFHIVSVQRISVSDFHINSVRSYSGLNKRRVGAAWASGSHLMRMFTCITWCRCVSDDVMSVTDRRVLWCVTWLRNGRKTVIMSYLQQRAELRVFEPRAADARVQLDSESPGGARRHLASQTGSLRWVQVSSRAYESRRHGDISRRF